MTRDFVHINDFILLLEEASSDTLEIDSCRFEEPLIAIAFYGSGNVDLTVRYGEAEKAFQYTKGLALSFYADDQVAFEHSIAPNKNLECIVIATTVRNLDLLPFQEGELFKDLLHELANPKDHYVEGPSFYMTPEMQGIVDAIFANQYAGKTKMMFMRSQIIALLSHFFGQLGQKEDTSLKMDHRSKLNEAKDILLSNLENPPSLKKLSEQLGINTTTLKKEFKAVFGAPVFKYLQNERLTTAHNLLNEQKATVQEAAWSVGYDSLGSFSNAFEKKFGYRPSQIK
ncbi:helix-turn-helix transcriptional regulator [Ekhidna sp. To15]|uniref:helix-turn-helix transcriptional regulator n=1 Tax=Ekhidna sp. To15 TaxID=3395267 RepID=UPI003F51F34B